MSQMSLELVPFTLTIKVKLAFKLQQFWKKLTIFQYTFKLEVLIDHLPDFSRGAGWRPGGRHLFLQMQKKTPSLVNLCLPEMGNLFCYQPQINLGALADEI